MALTVGYKWRELGSGLKTTNIPAITAATTTDLIAAPGSNNNIIVYQIDCDLGTGDQIIVGDNNAVDGTDRIIWRCQSAGNFRLEYPSGWFCRANMPLQAITNNTSGNVNIWIRVTYATSL